MTKSKITKKSKTKKKIIVVSFFPVYPVTFGASVVTSSFFDNIKKRKKILFQISNNKFNNKNISNINFFSNLKIFKLFSVLLLIIKVLREIKFSKKKCILIIEGASWIGYSFILSILSECFYPEVKIIYRSHNIEYELRKEKSNFFISKLSFLFEKYVFNKSYLSTCVSKVDKIKIKKLYKIDSEIFPNIINITKTLKSNPEIKGKYLFYSGSYEYLPNKNAIDRLIQILMPKILIKYPNISLVITGNKKIPYKYKWLKNLKLVSKRKYLNILRNSLCLIAPLKEGHGTRVKIIEALCEGKLVISSKIGIEGINLNGKFPPPFICQSENSYLKAIDMILKKNKFKKLAKLNRIKYIKQYSAKLVTKNFVNKHASN